MHFSMNFGCLAGPMAVRGTTEEEIATGSDVAIIPTSRTSQDA